MIAGLTCVVSQLTPGDMYIGMHASHVQRTVPVLQNAAAVHDKAPLLTCLRIYIHTSTHSEGHAQKRRKRIKREIECAKSKRLHKHIPPTTHKHTLAPLFSPNPTLQSFAWIRLPSPRESIPSPLLPVISHLHTSSKPPRTAHTALNLFCAIVHLYAYPLGTPQSLVRPVCARASKHECGLCHMGQMQHGV